jgi:hypothetical protein
MKIKSNREFKFCLKCNKETQHQNGNTCRSCLGKRRRADPNYGQIIKKRNINYRLANKDKRRIYENNRLKINPSARLANRFRNWINKLITRKTGNATTLIGCSFEELKVHLESKFEPGMSWDNWGIIGWHIDHIRPLSSFDLTNIEQQKEAFSYKNLQPLWAQDNLEKSDKWETDRD